MTNKKIKNYRNCSCIGRTRGFGMNFEKLFGIVCRTHQFELIQAKYSLLCHVYWTHYFKLNRFSCYSVQCKFSTCCGHLRNRHTVPPIAYIRYGFREVKGMVSKVKSVKARDK